MCVALREPTKVCRDGEVDCTGWRDSGGRREGTAWGTGEVDDHVVLLGIAGGEEVATSLVSLRVTVDRRICCVDVSSCVVSVVISVVDSFVRLAVMIPNKCWFT